MHSTHLLTPSAGVTSLTPDGCSDGADNGSARRGRGDAEPSKLCARSRCAGGR